MARKLILGFVTILAVALLVWGCGDDNPVTPQDKTPPVIVVEEINLQGEAQAGYSLCGDLVITGTATDEDSNIDRVELLAREGNEDDWEVIATDEPEAGNSQFEFSISAALPGGEDIDIKLDAFDAVGNGGDTGNPRYVGIRVWNDTTAPQVVITSPQNNADIFCVGDELTATVTESNELASVELWANNVLYSDDYTVSDNTYTFTIALALPADDEGNVALQVKATDECGNIGPSQVVNINYSCPEPIFRITAPGLGESIPYQTDYCFAASATWPTRERPSFDKVEFYFDDASVPDCTDAEGSDGWTCCYDTGLFMLGLHTVHGKLYLSDGRIINSETQVTFSVGLPPVEVDITAPSTNDEMICGNYRFAATAVILPPGKDREIIIEEVQFFLDGDQTPFGTDENGSDGWAYEKDVTAMECGLHDVYAKAILTGGFEVNSDQVSFIKNCPPIPFFGPFEIIDSPNWVVRVDAHESFDDCHEQDAPLDFNWTCDDPNARLFTYPGGIEIQQGQWYEGDAYDVIDFHFTKGYGDYEVCLDLRDIYDITADCSDPVDCCQAIHIPDVTAPDVHFTEPPVNTVVGDHNVPVDVCAGGTDRTNWFPLIDHVSFSYTSVYYDTESGPICTDNTPDTTDPEHSLACCPWEADFLPVIGDYYDLIADPVDNSGNHGSSDTRRVYKSDLPVITGITRHIDSQPDRTFPASDAHAWANDLTPHFSIEFTDDNIWLGNPTPSEYLVQWDMDWDGNPLNFNVDEEDWSVTLNSLDYGWCTEYTLGVRIVETPHPAGANDLPAVYHAWTLTMENDPPTVTSFDVVDFSTFSHDHLVSGSAPVMHGAEEAAGPCSYPSGLDFGVLSASGEDYGPWGEFSGFDYQVSPYSWQIDGIPPFDFDPNCPPPGNEQWVDSADDWTITYRIYDLAGNWDQASETVRKTDEPCVVLPSVLYSNNCAQWDENNEGIPVYFDNWSVTDDNGLSNPDGIGWSWTGPFTGVNDPNWVDADLIPEVNESTMPELPWVWHFADYGFYSVRLIGQDATGRRAYSQTEVVEVEDCTNPWQPIITSPLTGTEFDRTVLIVVENVVDRAPVVDYVNVYANGTLICTINSPPWECEWDSQNFPCGAISLTAVSTDMAGNSSATSDPVAVTKIGGGPYNTMFLDAAGGSPTNRYSKGNSPSTVEFFASSVDDCGLPLTYHWDFDYDFIAFDEDEVTNVPTTSHSYVEGMYTCVVRVVNSAMDDDEAQALVSIRDTTNPLLSDLSAGAWCGDDNPCYSVDDIDDVLDPGDWGAQCGVGTYSVTATDMHDADTGIIDQFTIRVEGSGYDQTLTWINPDPWAVQPVTHVFDFDWDGLASGPYTITATAFDLGVPPNQSFPDPYTIDVYKSDRPYAAIDPDPVTGTYADEDTTLLHFSAFNSNDDENGGGGGGLRRYEWDMNWDGNCNNFNVDAWSEEPGGAVWLDYYVAGLGYGEYTVALRVIDNTGLWTITSVSVTITDTTTPDVLFAVPRPGDVLTDLEEFRIDPAGTWDRYTGMPAITKIEYYIENVRIAEIPAAIGEGTDYQFFYDVSSLVGPPTRPIAVPAGPIEVEARAYDRQGLVGTDAFIVYRSNTPLVNLPAGDDWNDLGCPDTDDYGFGVFKVSPNVASVDLSAMVDDDNNQLFVTIDWADGSAQQHLPVNVMTATHGYQIPGCYIVEVTVEDEYSHDGTMGNVGTWTVEYSTIFIDDEAPSIAWVAPLDGTPCLGSGLVIEVDGISDNYCDGNVDRVDFYVSVNGAAHMLLGSDLSAVDGWTYAWSYNPGLYPAGTSFCFAARVYDKAVPGGNMNEIGWEDNFCIEKNDLPWNLSIWNSLCDFDEAYVLKGTDVTYQGDFDNDGDVISNYVWDWECDNEPWDLSDPCPGPPFCPDENNPDNGAKTILTENFPTGDMCIKYSVIDECSDSDVPGSDDYSWLESTLHIYADTPPVIDNFLPVDVSQAGQSIAFSFDVSDEWYWVNGTLEVINVTDGGALVVELPFVSPAPSPTDCAPPPGAPHHFAFDLSTQCIQGDDELQVTVTVYDTEYDAGNPLHDDENSAQLVRTFTIDDVLGPYMDPTGWITPQNGDVLDAGTQPIIDVVVNPSDWHCTDISEVRFFLDDMGWPLPNDPDGYWDAVTEKNTGPDDNYPDAFNTTQNILGWDVGSHRIGLLIWDAAGNQSGYEVIDVTKIGPVAP